MATVTVRANDRVLGLKKDQVATLELDDRVQAHITAGFLTLVSQDPTGNVDTFFEAEVRKALASLGYGQLELDSATDSSGAVNPLTALAGVQLPNPALTCEFDVGERPIGVFFGQTLRVGTVNTLVGMGLEVDGAVPTNATTVTAEFSSGAARSLGRFARLTLPPGPHVIRPSALSYGPGTVTVRNDNGHGYCTVVEL